MGGDKQVDTPKEILELKRLAELQMWLAELAAACENRAGEGARERVAEIGADIVKLLVGRHGSETNLVAIAAVARVLLYILDETDKKTYRCVGELPERVM